MITFTEIKVNDYFLCYQQARPNIAATVFNSKTLRAESKCFSKTAQIYDNVFRSTVMQSLYVPPFHHFQEYMNGNYIEETDRCYLFPIADNIVATLLKYLDDLDLIKDSQSRDLILNEPRIIAHIRRIIQCFVVPSQSYGYGPSDIEITMEKVSKSCYIGGDRSEYHIKFWIRTH